MDKRFKTWLLISLALFMLNGLITSWFFPPKVAPVAQKPIAKENAKAEDDAKVAPETPRGKIADDADNPPAEKPLDGDAVPADAEKPAADDTAAEAPADKPKAVPQQWITLGSANPTSPYRMLVTLNNAGAAVERIEFNSPRYLELDDFSGYLGHLGLTTAESGGARVSIVGPGTPADAAGLKPGDVIKSLNGAGVASAKAFGAMLDKVKPKATVQIGIDRDGQTMALSAQLGRGPLSVIRPELATKPVDVTSKQHDPLSMLLTMHTIDTETVEAAKEHGVGKELKNLDLWTGTWEVKNADADSVTFNKQVPGHDLEVTKTFRLAKSKAATSPDDPVYHLELELSIRNTGNKAHTVAYQLDGPTGLPNEGAWYATKVSRNWSGGLRDIVVRFNDGDPTEVSCGTIAAGTEVPSWSDSPLDYIAVDAQYFSAAIMPLKSKVEDLWFSNVRPIRVGEIPKEKADHKLMDISFRLTSTLKSLARNSEPLTHKFKLFVGPKRPHLLQQYAAVPQNPQDPATLDDLVYYGYFGWVARPMLALLHFFYTMVGNYGVAIIMLTVCVRGAMFPISRKQAQSAAKMQELQPKIKEIAEKYKNNPQERQKAQMELFRKHNYNPLAGCLPMFIQLPIFIGLYRSLAVDVELRQAPLISQAVRWCSNLAAPDMALDWRSFMPAMVTEGHSFVGLGPYLNVLPLITIVLFLIQQKMFMPPPTDEQSAMQQKMMKYMMVFMGFMFFKVASGLCLYFIASSLWGIAERKLLPKATPPGGANNVPAGKPSPPPTANSNGSTGKGKKKQRS